jgi:tRNA (guanosine-2'-O-)-methyltransferase
MEDFDISNPVPYFLGRNATVCRKKFYSVRWFSLKSDVGFTESLNISVSAAIIIQNLTNRLRHSKIDWHLSEEEMLEKRLAWAKNSLKILNELKRGILRKIQYSVAAKFYKAAVIAREEAISVRISTK